MQTLILPEQAKILQAQHVIYDETELKDLQVPVKLFILNSGYTAYLITQDPDDHDYLWAIVDWMAIEMGSVSLSEITALGGLYIVERDIHFKPVSALEIWNKLNKIEDKDSRMARD